MPAFVICTLSEPPRKVVCDAPPVRVGRDGSNEIILTGRSVSREHAMFVPDETGRWHVSCVSDTNPIVVNGALVTTGAPVGEGTEVIVGADAMIVVSENAFTASAYMGAKRAFEKTNCANCGWTGLVSTARRITLCPRCTRAIDSAVRSLPDNEKGLTGTNPGFATGDTATHMIDPEAMLGLAGRVKVAQSSRLERIDGKEIGQAVLPMSIDKKVVLGKTADAAFRLHGMFVFGAVRISWQKDRYVAESELSFPSSLRVNGERKDVANLRNGDVLEIGSNRFRFVVG
jgi:hypothetical protein